MVVVVDVRGLFFQTEEAGWKRRRTIEQQSKGLLLITFGRTKDAHETRPSGVWSETGDIAGMENGLGGHYVRTDRLLSSGRASALNVTM